MANVTLQSLSDQLKASQDKLEKQVKKLEDKLDKIVQATSIAAKDELTIEETAIYTGLNIRYIYNLCSQRKIPYSKLGKKLYFNKSKLDEWITEDAVLTDREIEKIAITRDAILKVRKRRQNKTQTNLN